MISVSSVWPSGRRLNVGVFLQHQFWWSCCKFFLQHQFWWSCCKYNSRWSCCTRVKMKVVTLIGLSSNFVWFHGQDHVQSGFCDWCVLEVIDCCISCLIKTLIVVSWMLCNPDLWNCMMILITTVELYYTFTLVLENMTYFQGQRNLRKLLWQWHLPDLRGNLTRHLLSCLFVFVFKVFEQFNIEPRPCVCVSHKRFLRNYLKSSSNLTRWLPQTWKCTMC